MAKQPPRPGHASVTALSPAEERVFRLVGLGLTNRKLAEQLYIDETTLRTHVKRVHAKTGITGRALLAVESYKRFWATPNKFAAAIELLKTHGRLEHGGEAIRALEQAGVSE